MIQWPLGHSTGTILYIKMAFLSPVGFWVLWWVFLVNRQSIDSPFQNNVELGVFAV